MCSWNSCKLLKRAGGFHQARHPKTLSASDPLAASTVSTAQGCLQKLSHKSGWNRRTTGQLLANLQFCQLSHDYWHRSEVNAKPCQAAGDARWRGSSLQTTSPNQRRGTDVSGSDQSFLSSAHSHAPQNRALRTKLPSGSFTADPRKCQ